MMSMFEAWGYILNNIFRVTKIIYSQYHSLEGIKDALCNKFWMLRITQNIVNKHGGHIDTLSTRQVPRTREAWGTIYCHTYSIVEVRAEQEHCHCTYIAWVAAVWPMLTPRDVASTIISSKFNLHMRIRGTMWIYYANYRMAWYSLPVDARRSIYLHSKWWNVLYIWGLIICMTFEHMD